MAAYRTSCEHLFEELRRLDLVLNLQVARQRSDPGGPHFNEFRGLFIAEDEIDQLVDENSAPHSSKSGAINFRLGRVLSLWHCRGSRGSKTITPSPSATEFLPGQNGLVEFQTGCAPARAKDKK